MFSSTIEFMAASELRMPRNSGLARCDSARVNRNNGGVTHASASARRQSIELIIASAPTNMTTQLSAWYVTQLSRWRIASVSDVMRLMMSPVRVWLK